MDCICRPQYHAVRQLDCRHQPLFLMLDLQALTYLAFGMAFISLWIHKSAWLWGSFLVIALSLALNTKTIEPFALVPILTLFLLQFWFKRGVAGLQRWVAFGIAVGVSTALIFHVVPGFCNWKVTNRFWINFDAPFAGFFVLALNLPLLRSRQQWSAMAIKTIPLIVLGIGLMIALAVLAGPVSWEPKWPPHLFLRLASNLILVSAAEEGFFGDCAGGTIQQIGEGGGGYRRSAARVPLFTLCHVKWTASFSLLGFVFLAGILYGAIYQYTKSIESSILCHFTLNSSTCSSSLTTRFKSTTPELGAVEKRKELSLFSLGFFGMDRNALIFHDVVNSAICREGGVGRCFHRSFSLLAAHHAKELLLSFAELRRKCLLVCCEVACRTRCF